MRHRRLAAAAALLLGLWAADAHAADPARCKLVRLADIGWTDVTATTALTALVLRDLGYTARTTMLPVAATFRALHNRQADAFLGDWQPTMAAEAKPYIDDKSVEVLGANLTGAKYTLAVPQYTYDLGLHDFADIQKFGTDLDWKIYGIEPGNEGNQRVLDMIKNADFGLVKFHLVEGSEQAMLAELARDYRVRKPIVFLGWEPHPMNTAYRIVYLTGGDAVFGPHQGEATVYTAVRAGYVDECPNVGRLLSQVKFDLAGVDAMMDSIMNHRMDATRAASAWLKANPDAVKTWLDGVTTFDGKPAALAVAAKP
jgi:glycine betaine/proline transport system substrate-binding protein